MFDFGSKITVLKNIKAPVDLIKSNILKENSGKLALETLENDVNMILPSKNVVFKNIRAGKKPIKNVWDVDIRHSGPGYFDCQGNFILDKPKKITNSWIIKTNEKMEGPFTDKEIMKLIEERDNSKEEILIKRDSDKGFVILSKLIKSIPNFVDVSLTNPKEISKFMSENKLVEEVVKNDDFFEQSISSTQSNRLSNFMLNHEISASVDFIIKKIKNTKKSHAMNVIENITGLDRPVCGSFLDLIIESAGYQILSDVDKDGFYINDKEEEKTKKH